MTGTRMMRYDIVVGGLLLYMMHDLLTFGVPIKYPPTEFPMFLHACKNIFAYASDVIRISED